MLFAELEHFSSLPNVLFAVAILCIAAPLCSSTTRIAFVEAAVNVRQLKMQRSYSSTLTQEKITCQLFELSRRAHGSKAVPGVPFQWPNGQGTIKFFGGRNAAREWREQYGSLYSIWSGFKREMSVACW